MQGWIEFCLYVVAYLVARKAVQGRGELAVLIVVTAVVIWPVKTIGAYVSPAFTQSAVTVVTEPHLKMSFHPTIAFPVTIIIASVLMLLGEEVIMAVRRRGDAGGSEA